MVAAVMTVRLIIILIPVKKRTARMILLTAIVYIAKSRAILNRGIVRLIIIPMIARGKNPIAKMIPDTVRL